MLALLLGLGCVNSVPESITNKPPAMMTITQNEDGTIEYSVDPWSLEFESIDGNADYRSFGIQNGSDMDLAIVVAFAHLDDMEQVFYLDMSEGMGVCRGTGESIEEPALFDECEFTLQPGQILSGFVVFEPGWSAEAMARPSHAATLTVDIGADTSIETLPDGEDTGATVERDYYEATIGLTGRIVDAGGTYTSSGSVEDAIPDFPDDTGGI